MTTYAEMLQQRTETGRARIAAEKRHEAAEKQQAETRRVARQTLARLEWLTRNLPTIKNALLVEADCGRHALRLFDRDLDNRDFNVNAPGCMSQLAAALSLSLGIKVVGDTTSKECDMGDSAAPCRTTITTSSLEFSWENVR